MGFFQQNTFCNIGGGESDKERNMCPRRKMDFAEWKILAKRQASELCVS